MKPGLHFPTSMPVGETSIKGALNVEMTAEGPASAGSSRSRTWTWVPSGSAGEGLGRGDAAPPPPQAMPPPQRNEPAARGWRDDPIDLALLRLAEQTSPCRSAACL